MTPWLTLIGIGEDGIEGLSAAARRHIAEAELVVGGRRHLALAGTFPGEALAWPSPLTDAFPHILARRGGKVVVLASGDPFFHGVGSTLAAHVAAAEMRCLPAPSAFSLAAARLCWAQQDCALVSLHGHALERIIPHLQPGARILALSWDKTTPGKLAALLAARGCGRSRLFICEAMGGPREKLRSALAQDFAIEGIDPLNTVGIEVVAAPDARIVTLSPGLADELFEHDGQISKRDIRSLSLSALAPRQGELLWDIGAGSGSVGIEWMLRHKANRAIAIEARPDRAARIARNAASLGVPDLRVVEGRAPAALAGLPRPDAVFIGGGAGEDGVLDGAWNALPQGGRIAVDGRHSRDPGAAHSLARIARRRAHALADRAGGADRRPRSLPPCAPGDALERGEAVSAILAIGIGCRKDCGAAAIAALVREACAMAAQPGPFSRPPLHLTGQGRAGGPRRSSRNPRPRARRASSSRARSGSTALHHAFAARRGAHRLAFASRSRSARRSRPRLAADPARISRDGASCALAASEAVAP